jgi:hypothetical protein
VQNPFGDAKPREKVLASRTGKSETEILKEEVKAEKPKVRATAATAAGSKGRRIRIRTSFCHQFTSRCNQALVRKLGTLLFGLVEDVTVTAAV